MNGLLIRPTRNEYIEFIKLLDKILSDNIDKNFFKDRDIAMEREKKKRWQDRRHSKKYYYSA